MLPQAGFVLIPCNVNVLHTCLQGKETSLTTTGEKDLDMETKLTDKNIDRAGQLCLDTGLNVGGQSSELGVKHEDEADDRKALKDTVIDLRSTYQTFTLCISEIVYLSQHP